MWLSGYVVKNKEEKRNDPQIKKNKKKRRSKKPQITQIGAD